MTTFQDGPAKGQTLILKRAARFLRVVDADGKFDALDQPEDAPNPNETLYAYEIAGPVGNCHIWAGRGRSGFYPVADYRIVKPQPTDAEMRGTNAWHQWCLNQAGQS